MIRLPPAPFAVVRFHLDWALSPDDESRWLLLSNPSQIVTGRVGEAPHFLPALENRSQWFGYLGYELGEWTEAVLPREPCDWGLPDFWFADFRHCEPVAPVLQGTSLPDTVPPIESSLSPAEHGRRLTRIQDYLGAGDIYQANLTVRYQAPGIDDPWNLFLRVAERAQAPYTAYLDSGDWKILTFSPELFLKRDGKRILTNPIKGTVARATQREEDQAAADWLRQSEKNLAELLMIVDLERNDLGRVCRPGSIEWGPFPELVTLPNVHHLCCPVSGVLQPNVSLVDILKATFPGGSISGAPKRRALQILRELEPHRRGPYCGAIGYVNSDRFLLNVGIRTGVWKEGSLRFWGGGGIVADHDPEQEQAEIRSKLEPFSSALGVAASDFWRAGP